jgi:hypothetical protein
MALAYLSPALKDGWYFGPYDAGANGTIGHPGNPINHAVYNRINGDLIDQGIPWNTIDWRLIHAGHLPLWNSYNVLGLPQLFNFESAAFSLPDLFSYAVPLRYAWLVIALVKLLVAGTGAYVLARQLAAGPLGASFAGISFMLSGGYANWLGWSLSGVVAWAPWICAFLLLSYRDRRRRWPALLAVSVMFAFFGGFPEMYALLAGALAVLVVGAALTLLVTRRRPSLPGAARAAFGLAAGAALACPLLLPGSELISRSTHAASKGVTHGAPISRIVSFLSAGYYGLPIRGSVTFPGVNFYETVAYIGILAIALALVGAALARRQAAVIGMALFTVACLVMTYRIGSFNPGGQLLAAIGQHAVHASRIRLLADLGIAVLAGIGLDRVVVSRTKGARSALVAAAVGGAALVGAVVAASAAQHLRGVLGAERFDGLLWPCGLAVAGLVAALVLGFAPRSHRGVGAIVGIGLVGVQAAWLLFSGVGLNTWTSVGYRHYPATTQLSRIVGRSVVGLDGQYPGSPKTWPRLGFYPNINIVYGVAEFAAHDPLLPASFARAFPVPPRHRRAAPSLSALDMPHIASAALARKLGIAYLLVQPGFPIPAGTTLVATISGERLVRVGGAERFSFVPGGGGRVTGWSQPVDNRWVIHVDAPSPAPASRVLVLRLTRVPGFSASAGGRSLPLRRFGAFEMAVTVPRGVSTVTVTYWPGRFTDGLVVAGVAVVVLALWCAVPLVRRRHE